MIKYKFNNNICCSSFMIIIIDFENDHNIGKLAANEILLYYMSLHIMPPLVIACYN